MIKKIADQHRAEYVQTKLTALARSLKIQTSWLLDATDWLLASLDEVWGEESGDQSSEKF